MSRREELIAGLQEALENVLEEAAFVFIEPDPEPSEPGQGVVEALVAVSGPVTGDLVLATSEDFSLELAANLLGREQHEVSDGSTRADALGETLNIVAGHFMAAAYGTGRHFRLGAPRVRRVPAGASLFSGPAPIRVLADGEHPIACTFLVRESVLPGEAAVDLGVS